MTRIAARALLTVALAAGLAWPGAAQAAPAIMPLDDVRIGMKGYGKTVFEGTRIDRFDVTVIGVLESFEFETDMILIRVENGPVVTKGYGIIAGMSGSPIYIDGKMIGALAYGWSFQKEPIAGVTPIEQMISQYDPQHPEAKAARARRQLRKERQDGRLAAAPRPLEGSLRPVGGTLEVGGQTVNEVRVAPNRGEAERLGRTRSDVGVLVPVQTPLFVRGLSGPALRLLERVFEPFNLLPMQVSGGGASPDTEVDFSPGAAIAVPITYGDIQLTGVGTLTYRDENLVLGFGHPMFNLGRVDMPMATAYIHTVIGSSLSSSKLGGPIKRIGRISQDRTTCIGGKIGAPADTVGVRYTLTEKDRGSARDFRVDLLRQPGLTEILTTLLMQMAVQNVAGAYFDGVTSTRIEITTRVKQNGQPLKIVRENSFDSKALGMFGVNPLLDLFSTLTLLRQNPFGEAPVQSVNVDLQFEAARRFAAIERAQVSQQVVRPGQKVAVTLYLKPYGGGSTPLTIPVEVPENAPGGPLILLFIGGNDAFALRPRINPPPMPNDVPTLVEWLNNRVRNDSVVVETVLPTAGLEINRKQLPDLPDPIVGPLASSNADGMRQFRDIEERVVPTSDVVAGVAAVMVEVASDEAPRQGAQKSERPGLNIEPPPMQQEPTGPVGELPGGDSAITNILGAGDLGPELTWMLRPARRTSVTPEQMAQLLRDTCQRYRPRTVRRSWLAPSRPQRRGTGGEATPTDKPGDKPSKGDGPAADAPPDVTDSLELKKPPKMPTWEELDELAKAGKVAKEPSGEDDDQSKSSEDEDGEPIGRPMGVWSLVDSKGFAEGKFTGTYGSSSGRVGLAPAVSSLGRPDAERLWAVLPRPDGGLMVGSWGPRAKLYRMAPDGKAEVWLETDDAGLQALTALGDGSVAVGGIPSGRIYQVRGKGLSKVLATLPERYIWQLAPAAGGGLYAATGNRGRLYHVTAAGVAAVVLQAADRHLLAMAAMPDGGVAVGSWPMGKVYRVKGTEVESLFQVPDGGVLSLAATTDKRVYVGAAGAATVYRLEPDGQVTELALGEGGDVYAMTAIGNTVYAGTASPARLHRLEADGEITEIYHSEEPFVLGLGAAKNALVTTIAGSGEVVAMALGGSRRGTYLSPIHDAGTRARWGMVRWRGSNSKEARILIETRTGNTAYPDKAWSGWSPMLAAPDGSPVPSPAARYVQFRATLLAGADGVCHLDRVDLLYRTLNRPPTVAIKEPETGAVVRGKLKVKWEAEDPDDDKLHYEVFYAPAGSKEWTKVEAAAEDGEGKEGKAKEGKSKEGQDPDDKDGPAAGKAKPKAAPKGGEAKADAGSVALVAAPGWLRRLWRRLDSSIGDSGKAGKERPGTKPPSKKAKPEPGDKEPGKAKAKAVKEKNLSDESITWDTTALPDGLYRVKVVAYDDLRNPDDPKQAEAVSRPFRVQNAGPFLVGKPLVPDAAPPEVLEFGDDGTYLASAEYRYDDDEWKALMPVDGLFDSRFERIKRPALPEDPGQHTLTIRVRDAAGNVSRFQWTFTIAEK